MPKYRNLSSEELIHFEKEFIEFLVVNGIDAADWESIIENQPEEMHRIIELFSDVVFEKILRKTKYLINTAESQLYAFYYGDKDAKLYLAEFEDVDLTGIEGEEELLKIVVSNDTKLNLHFQEKKYQMPREQELFKLLSTCIISDGSIYSHFNKRQKENQK